MQRMQSEADSGMTDNDKIRCSLDTMEARSPSDEFKFDQTTNQNNPFVSPYYATDDVLKQLPPVKIIVSCQENSRYQETVPETNIS